MYLRFVCAAPHPYAAAELGIYQATRLIDWEDQPRWLAKEFRRAFVAAADGLAVPECVSMARTADGRRSVCWLKAENAPRIAATRHLAWVMGELGVPVAGIGARNPGHIIYRDVDQVVALPQGRVRRAFPRR
ncbi:MAG TPA: hypothetical protein VLA52_03985 [Thermohalobaculum sp.]|nr:hypothetical protein [Thermohalobaculum sp.]